MRALPWVLVVILVAVIGLGAFKFMIQGSTEQAEDGRTAVLLTPVERNRVLGEMRAMLEAVQEMTAAIAADDMDAIAAVAGSVGMAATRGESVALMGKLPADFKLQGLAVHQGFDELAALADIGIDPIEMVAALSDHLSKCTACHAGYRFDIAR